MPKGHDTLLDSLRYFPDVNTWRVWKNRSERI